MRKKVTAETLKRFMRELASHSQGGGAVYFTGGATALLLGFREQTIDVDILMDPEPRGAFQAIAQLKNALDVNIELASPADFIPVTPDWKEKSLFIETFNGVSFSHFDLRAQALSKIERGYTQDLADARHLVELGKVSAHELKDYFERVKPGLIRYPAIDSQRLEKKVAEFLKEYAK